MKPAIILHGGAGKWQENKISKANKILEKAADIGIKLLKNNKPSLDAVEESINLLENSGYFNCGIGSVAQADGKVRMDAGIMDGKTLKCGAVGAIENIKHPISVARKVMEKTYHCLLVSKYATEFAIKNGFKKIKISPKEIPKSKRLSDTVGAVAIDKKGNIAVGNSTGGVYGDMLPGRVGDSAIPGAGFYANEYAGAVTTGIGESFIRTTGARKAVDIVQEGKQPKEAAKILLRIIKQKIGYDGGIIILDKKGNYAAHHTTKAMPWVYKRG
jgi:beta-aspartyl-peptidase (threonine type)